MPACECAPSVLITPLVAVQPVAPDSKPGLVSFWPEHEPPPPEREIVQVNVALPEAPVVSVAVTVTEYVPAVVGVPGDQARTMR